jgi:hypothetical protein
MAMQGMLRPEILRRSQWAATLVAFGLASTQAQAAASATMMGNIGDANKASGLIRHYSLDAATRTMQATAAVPSEGVSIEVIRKVTIQTAHDICADARGAGWTLKVYLPDQSDPIVTCRFR